LTHVCDRLIGMAIPCVEGAVYRNDIREVRAVQDSITGSNQLIVISAVLSAIT
jgi:hypothetical protein